MNLRIREWLFILTGITLVILSSSCRKEAQLATLTTSAAAISNSSDFMIAGAVTNNGGTPIIEKGICYMEVRNFGNPKFDRSPTIQDNKLPHQDCGGGHFQLNFRTRWNRKYIACSYAINSVGVAYGNPVEIKTANLGSANGGLNGASLQDIQTQLDELLDVAKSNKTQIEDLQKSDSNNKTEIDNLKNTVSDTTDKLKSLQSAVSAKEDTPEFKDLKIELQDIKAKLSNAVEDNVKQDKKLTKLMTLLGKAAANEE